MTHSEFEMRFAEDQRMLQAWGDLVTSTIVEGLPLEVGLAGSEHFLKISPVARVKDRMSLLAKAFYRKKKYSNPYEDITDKVGTRFVVMLRTDVEIVSRIIEKQESAWDISQDRDFESERLERPNVFEYQSRHYIVRPKCDIEIQPGKDDVNQGTITIGANTPCEIQIRSLLQHAYSELTHDTIYKPVVKPTNVVERQLAKSMALIEAVDDIFINAMETIKDALEPLDSRLTALSDLYTKLIGAPLETDEQANIYVLDEVTGHAIDSIDTNDLEQWFQSKTFVISRIRTNYKAGFWYKQPAILYLYYAADKRRATTKARWPFNDDELQPLYADLGISFE